MSERPKPEEPKHADPESRAAYDQIASILAKLSPDQQSATTHALWSTIHQFEPGWIATVREYEKNISLNPFSSDAVIGKPTQETAKTIEEKAEDFAKLAKEQGAGIISGWIDPQFVGFSQSEVSHDYPMGQFGCSKGFFLGNSVRKESLHPLQSFLSNIRNIPKHYLQHASKDGDKQILTIEKFIPGKPSIGKKKVILKEATRFKHEVVRYDEVEIPAKNFGENPLDDKPYTVYQLVGWQDTRRNLSDNRPVEYTCILLIPDTLANEFDRENKENRTFPFKVMEAVYPGIITPNAWNSFAPFQATRLEVRDFRESYDDPKVETFTYPTPQGIATFYNREEMYRKGRK